VLDACDVVLDVGAVFDAARHRFDHHQRGFGEVFGHGFNTKLSSAGTLSQQSLLAACAAVASHNALEALEGCGDRSLQLPLCAPLCDRGQGPP
jgi:uncharacterized UPF0160 family protein